MSDLADGMTAGGGILGALGRVFGGGQGAPSEPDGEGANGPPSATAAPGGPDMELAERLRRWVGMVNVAEDVDEEERSRIAQLVLREYDIDKQSRAEWEQKYEEWLNLAMQIAEEKQYPWPRASNVIYPLLTTASIQFAARAYPAIIRDRNVVKGTVWGKDEGEPQINPQTGQPLMDQGGQPVWAVPPGAKRLRADRIGQHMSWQLLQEQEEWEPETDRLLIVLPIVGCMFRKSYFDPVLQRNVSETVDALHLVVNYKVKAFERAPRVTEIIELYPHEVEERIRAGVFLEEDYGFDQDAGQDEQAPMTFLEQHRRYDLDGDGYEEPYIVTVARDSGRLARIKAAYDMDGVLFSATDHRIRKVTPVAYYTKYGFIPNPESGVYDLGFGHLLSPINEAINTSLNQLFDAGHLANAGGGFIGSGLSLNTGAVRFALGEYKPVNVGGGTIRDNVFPLPFPGPNAVLFSLLQFLVEAAKEVAAVKDVMVGDLPGDNTSGVATLAMIEQGLKVFSAIYKRIHRALKSEFKKLFRLNRIYLPATSQYEAGGEWHDINRADYESGTGVEPVSDPQMVTDMQALGRSQFLLQFKDDPYFQPLEIRRRMLDAALFPESEKLLNANPAPPPEALAAQQQLQLEEKAEEFRRMELQIRAAHQEGELDIRRGEQRSKGILTLAQAINQLAQAAKADSEVNLAWYQQRLEALRQEMDSISDEAQSNPAANSPALAGIGGAPPAAPGGVQPAVPAMAPPSGHAAPPAVPGGLPPVGGGANAGGMAQGQPAPLG